jgi:hypothetical protein
VYALPAQVCRLVEAIRPAAARALDADDALDDCALRRRPAAGQIQAGGLARLDLPEAKYPDRNSDGERSAAGGPGDLEPGHCDPADLVSKNASVERLQADTSIPPSGEEKRRAESGRAPVAKQQGQRRENDGAGDKRTRRADDQRECKADAERAGENVRRWEVRRPAHRSTTFLSSARRAGPIPGTASSSSTDLKAPCSLR